MGRFILLFVASFLGIGASALMYEAILAEQTYRLVQNHPLFALIVAALITAVVIYFYLKLSDKNKALEKRLEELKFQMEQLKKKLK